MYVCVPHESSEISSDNSEGISLLQCGASVLSHIQLFDPMSCRTLGSFVHEISRQEKWIGLPFPSPGDFPNTGIVLVFPALVGGFFNTEPPEKLV